MYKLKDWNDEPIIGSFYMSELSGVSKDVDSLFFYRKSIKKEKERGQDTVICQVGWISFIDELVGRRRYCAHKLELWITLYTIEATNVTITSKITHLISSKFI